MRRGYDHEPPKTKRDNMSKLMAVSKMAMRHRVMLSIDGGRLKSLSLAEWQRKERIVKFEERWAVLGVFFALKGETRADVYRRLYDEAKACGALLGPPVL